MSDADEEEEDEGPANITSLGGSSRGAKMKFAKASKQCKAKRPGSGSGRDTKGATTGKGAKGDGGDVKWPQKKRPRGLVDCEAHVKKWNSRFEELKTYKEKHGHCNVPLHPTPEYKKLATWVSSQRTSHRQLREGKPNSMTPERIQKLNSLGFQWIECKTPPVDFEVRLGQLAVYKEKHGHCNVPQYCKEKDCPAGLGNFVLTQRRHYKALVRGGKPASLTPERIAQLERLGFNWTLRKYKS